MRKQNWMKICFGMVGIGYCAIVAGLVVADLMSFSWVEFWDEFWADGDLVSAVRLSLVTSVFSASFGLVVAVPIAYMLSRKMIRFGWLFEMILDVPLVLPPVVLGVSLVLLFTLLGQSSIGFFVWLKGAVLFEVPAVILAQMVLVVAYGVRTMKIAFDQMSERQEQVAMTLGCSRFGAFWRVLLPEARGSLVGSWGLGFARSMGEFGPILIFAGATRGHTEVMSTAIYNRFSGGELNLAIGLSVMMILLSVGILFGVRLFGFKGAAV